MRRPILLYPDPRLGKPCAPVTTFGAPLRALADELFATMRAAPGVGITAAHIGEPLRLVVLDLPALGGRRDFANPELLWSSETTMTHDEGSVSMPGMIASLERPNAVRLRYQDLDGEAHEIDLEGFAAICMQHEIDQLDGMFWIERLSRLKRDRLLKAWKKSRS